MTRTVSLEIPVPQSPLLDKVAATVASAFPIEQLVDGANNLAQHAWDHRVVVASVSLTAYFLWKSRELLFYGPARKHLNVTIPAEAYRSHSGAEVLANPSLKMFGDDKIATYDKITHEKLGSGTAPVFSDADVKAAVARSRKAQGQWGESSFDTRRQFLRYLNDFITEHQEEICVVASRETGKTMVDGGFGEVLTTCEKIQWTIENGEEVLKTEKRGTGMLMLHKVARVEYVPLGVLGAIIPWNYPFHNMLGQVISAVFAGNGIVIKVSEYASWSATFYLDIVREALRMVGQDPELVQVVTGYGLTGASLCNSGVEKVVFIGSPGVGKLVMRQAADTFTPVVLELGGKDAAVVCDDCDFNQVVNLALRGTFQNCGQNCIGLERVIAHTNVYDKLVAELEIKVNKLSQGNPLKEDVDCGAMTMGEQAAEKLQTLVEDAVKRGARCLAGGKKNGPYFTPTLLVDVTPDMEIAQEEAFGPIMTVMRARDDDHAVELANGCQYGLGSSVFSLDYSRAEKIVHRLATGMCNINDFGVNYLCQALPFGGVKISGFDRFAGIEGLRGCCVARSITTDKYPGVRTDIPPPLQYPLSGSGFQFCASLVNLFYSPTMGKRLGAMLSLAKIGASEPAKK